MRAVSLLWLAALMGCGGQGPGGTTSTSSTTSPLVGAATPSAGQMRPFLRPLADAVGAAVAVPSPPAALTPSAGTAAPIADLYLATRAAGGQLDGMAASVNEAIGQILQSPPTTHGQGQAVWGPFTPPLSLAAFRLVASVPSTGAPLVHLDVKPKDAPDDAFQPYVAGTPGVALQVELSVLHAVDPLAMPLQGAYAVQVSGSPNAVTVGLQLRQVTPGGQPPVDADYAHAQANDGSGTLELASPGQVLKTHWEASGAGRGSLARADGSTLVECWNEQFQLVFLQAQPQGFQDGNPAACVP